VNSTENTTSVAAMFDVITIVNALSTATVVLLIVALLLLVVTDTTPTVRAAFFRVAVHVPAPLRA
tara:strand:+ start:380 stop:574 length:195 start_codon:yes stop_codon:yes gene_type:complete